MATEQEIINMRKTLDNRILRSQILGFSRKKSVKKIAKEEAEIDSDYDEFEYNFLKNWNKLEDKPELVPEVYNEVKNLSKEERKKKIDELKNKFAANLVDSENYNKGYEYAKQYKDMWVSRIKTKFKK